jgi:hypothetical protein
MEAIDTTQKDGGLFEETSDYEDSASEDELEFLPGRSHLKRDSFVEDETILLDHLKLSRDNDEAK